MRVGLGPQALATPLIPPQTAPVDELEPLTTGAMQRFLATHSTLEDLPMAVSLRAFYHVTISGEPRTVRGTARAVAACLAALHSPEDMVIAVAAGRESAPEWEWAKWLPHLQTRGVTDGAGSMRLITSDPLELEERLDTILQGRPRFHPAAPPVADQPHLVVVLDGVSLPPTSLLASPEGLQGVTVVEVVPGDLSIGRGDLSVIVHPKELRLESSHGMVYEGMPDLLSYEAAEALARQLAPLRMGTGGDDGEPLLANLEFTDLLNLGARPRWTRDAPGGRVRSRSGCGSRSVSARTAGP
ncbi:Type VII secretion protein EccCa OS=Streptomyces alboniger OX=132473 GN=eccCa PE=4 SV=1 [Streptomyces alboniger]